MIAAQRRICGPLLALACLIAVPPALAHAQAPAGASPGSEEHDHASAGSGEAESRDGRTPSPAGAYVYIGWPQDGTVIHSTRFKVWFGARNIGVAPSGVRVPGTGHHHLLIDAPLPSDLTSAIPSDKSHLHFGLGETETVIELPPGRHTLQLLMADADHVPHNPPLFSRRITIYVRQSPSARVSSAE